MDSARYGVLLAAVIGGPPLWSLYQAGDLDLSTALLRGGLVALGCALGIAGLNRIIRDYRTQQARARRIQQLTDAVDGLVHEGTPLPGPNGQAGSPPGSGV